MNIFEKIKNMSVNGIILYNPIFCDECINAEPFENWVCEECKLKQEERGL